MLLLRAFAPAFAVLFVLLAPGAARCSAQVQVPAGFSVRVIPTGFETTGMDLGPGGAFGSDLYASTDGAIKRINPYSGAISTLAIGLAGGAGRPGGVAFDRSTFNTGSLLVCQNNGSVVTVSAGGTVTGFSAGNTLFSCNDLVFTGATSAFGARLFVSNADANPPFSMSAVGPGGTNTVFVPGSRWTGAPGGLDYAPASSGFLEGIYATQTDGKVVRIDAGGNVTVLAPGLGLLRDVVVSRSTAFGSFLYVTDFSSQSILRISPAGQVTTFATGLSTSAGFDADLRFDVDGQTLYVANGPQIVAIRACTAGSGQANSSSARLEANGAGLDSCAGPHAIPLLRGGTLTLLWQGPGGLPYVLFAGGRNTLHPSLGCGGRLDIGTPPGFGDLLFVLGGGLDANGRAQQVIPLPTLPVGAGVNVQGAVVGLSGCAFVLTAAFHGTVR